MPATTTDLTQLLVTRRPAHSVRPGDVVLLDGPLAHPFVRVVANDGFCGERVLSFTTYLGVERSRSFNPLALVPVVD